MAVILLAEKRGPRFASASRDYRQLGFVVDIQQCLKALAVMGAELPHFGAVHKYDVLSGIHVEDVVDLMPDMRTW